MSANVITLNVGGKIFATTAGTLREATKLSQFVKDSSSLLEDGDDSKRTETLFIDRDPTYFAMLLKYLRDGKVRLSMCAKDIEGLREEAEARLIQPSIILCNS
ncbi:unnamed protein product [Strongylus vulgaris]|uniref:Potassium channel tetramerisation-type BTB domain-containing protein n=1 Tax=Strongylus vulgaris TaxID=40348 RepID=A0A3P7JNL7_STRVU|nr:unnamed protein product [Strongylus vulgaris]